MKPSRGAAIKPEPKPCTTDPAREIARVSSTEMPGSEDRHRQTDAFESHTDVENARAKAGNQP